MKKTVGAAITCLPIETAADFDKALAALKGEG